MKKKTFLIPLLSLTLILGACSGPSPSSSQPSSESEATSSESITPSSSSSEVYSSTFESSEDIPSAEVLANSLHEYAGFKGSYTWSILNENFVATDSYRFTNDIYISPNEWYLYQVYYNEVGGTDTNLDTHYIRGDDGVIYYDTWTYENNIERAKLTDPIYGDYMYDDYFWNPFMMVGPEDFEYIGGNTFNLLKDNFASTGAIPYMLFYYSNNQFEVKECTFKVDDEGHPLSIELLTYAAFNTNTKPCSYVQLHYEGTYASREEFDGIDLAPAEVNNDILPLDSALKNLRGNTYILSYTDSYSSSGSLTVNTRKNDVYVTEDAIIDSYNQKAYLYRDNGVIEGDMTATGIDAYTSPITTITLDYYVTDFLYSAAFFTKTSNNTYVLKEGMPTEYEHLLPDYNFSGRVDYIEADTLKITLNDDGTVSYSYDYRRSIAVIEGTVEATIKDIGTATLPADIEPYINYHQKATSYADAVENIIGSTYQQYVNLLGADLDNILTYYEPDCGWQVGGGGTSATYARFGINNIKLESDVQRYVSEFSTNARQSGWETYRPSSIPSPLTGDAPMYRHYDTGIYFGFTLYTTILFIFFYPPLS